jgi:hypothetical protein
MKSRLAAAIALATVVSLDTCRLPCTTAYTSEEQQDNRHRYLADNANRLLRVKVFADTNNVFWDRNGAGKPLAGWIVTLGGQAIGASNAVDGTLFYYDPISVWSVNLCVRPAFMNCTRAGFECVQTIDSLTSSTFPYKNQVAPNPGQPGIIWMDTGLDGYSPTTYVKGECYRLRLADYLARDSTYVSFSIGIKRSPVGGPQPLPPLFPPAAPPSPPTMKPVVPWPPVKPVTPTIGPSKQNEGMKITLSPTRIPTAPPGGQPSVITQSPANARQTNPPTLRRTIAPTTYSEETFPPALTRAPALPRPSAPPVSGPQTLAPTIPDEHPGYRTQSPLGSAEDSRRSLAPTKPDEHPGYRTQSPVTSEAIAAATLPPTIADEHHGYIRKTPTDVVVTIERSPTNR